MQQPTDVLGEFTRYVEHGTIGNHGEPLTLDLIFANPVLPGAPRHVSQAPTSNRPGHPVPRSLALCAVVVPPHRVSQTVGAEPLDDFNVLTIGPLGCPGTTENQDPTKEVEGYQLS